MKKLLLLLLSCFIVTMSLSAQSKEETAIRNVLNESAIAWNKGNIEGFMNAYWQSDSLMFIGNEGITYGWQNTLNTYKRGYPDTASMGKLQMEVLEIKRLSAIYFFVIGKWNIDRSTGKLSGAFTLIFRKVKNKWVIVADHSS